MCIRDREGDSLARVCEAKVIAEELGHALDSPSNLTFGIITFYSGQVERIWEELRKLDLAVRGRDGEWGVNKAVPRLLNSKGAPRVRVGTVDAFQGREFDVVYLSTVRCPRPGQPSSNPYGFLVLPNRLNVAMSRQKKLLLVVGNSSLFSTDDARTRVPALAEFLSLTNGPDGYRA